MYIGNAPVCELKKVQKKINFFRLIFNCTFYFCSTELISENDVDRKWTIPSPSSPLLKDRSFNSLPSSPALPHSTSNRIEKKRENCAPSPRSSTSPSGRPPGPSEESGYWPGVPYAKCDCALAQNVLRRLA